MQRYKRKFEEAKKVSMKESNEAYIIYENILKLIDHPKYNVVMVTMEIADAIELACKHSLFASDKEVFGKIKNNLLNYIKRMKLN
jgi:ABC-type nitrate/sulfonate/bicarbonate transport system ATPase subunit